MKLLINSLFKEYQNRVILDGITATLGVDEAIGLIGANGSGKTTLLKILAGVESSDKGEVEREPRDLTIGYIPQVADLPATKTVTEGLTQALGMADEENYRVYIALHELGIDQLAFRKFGELSAGQKTRVYLARLVIQKPDVLLLDEPTNHLDVEALEWLEKYLQNYKGSYLVVSHDRRFLDNTVGTIWELEKGKIEIYGGNYSDYREQKSVKEKARARNYFAYEKKSNRILERVRIMKNKTRQLEARTTGADHYMRRKAALSASKAKSTEKMLLKQLDKSGVEKPIVVPELSLIFKPKRESGKTVVYLDKVSKSFGKIGVIGNLTMVISQKERIGLIGPNGSGKSTLVRLMLGQLKPTSGTVTLGNKVDFGYLPQEQLEDNSNLTLLEYLVGRCQIERTTAYRLAKRFQFADEDIKTDVNKLSRGLKSKIKLASIMASGANFIILDEPTNYLDIPSREAVEEAIISYPGTILVITHDRYFLERINPTKVISLR